MVFPEIPELGDVLNSTVVRGALSSLLGPDSPLKAARHFFRSL